MGRRLVSIESLPFTCDAILETIAGVLKRETTAKVVFGKRSVAAASAPRPAPAPYDFYHELSATLHRLRAVRDAAAQSPASSDIYLVDGWIPAAPPPHPIVARLTSQLAACVLRDAAFVVHDALLIDGSPHASFEGWLEWGADAEIAPGLQTFASVTDARIRYHTAFQRQCLSPIPCGRLYKIDVDPNADYNLTDAHKIAQAAVAAILI